MARDIIDDRLLGALHVQAMNRAAFRVDPAVDHAAFQAGTLNTLMEGHLDGDVTVGEVLAHGGQGIGTIRGLGGEVIVLDSEPWLIDGEGNVTRVPPDTPTPFLVVCRFSPTTTKDLEEQEDLEELHRALDQLADEPSGVVSIRVDGEFSRLRLRSVHAQKPPYPSLLEVTKHQTEWSVGPTTGTLVGFRFPDFAAGVEVPGYHLHFISDDRKIGGHVLDLTLRYGRASVDIGEDLHVELPEHIGLGEPGVADRAAIRSAEGGLHP